MFLPDWSIKRQGKIIKRCKGTLLATRLCLTKLKTHFIHNNSYLQFHTYTKWTNTNFTRTVSMSILCQ